MHGDPLSPNRCSCGQEWRNPCKYVTHRMKFRRAGDVFGQDGTRRGVFSVNTNGKKASLAVKCSREDVISIWRLKKGKCNIVICVRLRPGSKIFAVQMQIMNTLHSLDTIWRRFLPALRFSVQLIEGQQRSSTITLTRYSLFHPFEDTNSSSWTQVESQISSTKRMDLSQDQTMALWLQPPIGFLGWMPKPQVVHKNLNQVAEWVPSWRYCRFVTLQWTGPPVKDHTHFFMEI